MERMKGMTWEWIAGFVVGEGHIYWQDANERTSGGSCGRITLGQVYKEPLEAIQKFLLDRGYENPILYQRKQPDPTRKRLWTLTIQRRNDVIRFLDALQGLLYQKQEKANLVLGNLRHLNQKREELLNQATDFRIEGKSWREIARLTGVGRVALTSYFRTRGISLKDDKKGIDSKSWRQDRLDRGLCEQCGQPRGDDGSTRKCRECLNKYNSYRAAWIKQRIENGLCRRCGQSRGKDGTKLMCRSCADKHNRQHWIRENSPSCP